LIFLLSYETSGLSLGREGSGRHWRYARKSQIGLKKAPCGTWVQVPLPSSWPRPGRPCPAWAASSCGSPKGHRPARRTLPARLARRGTAAAPCPCSHARSHKSYVRGNQSRRALGMGDNDGTAPGPAGAEP